MIKTLLYAHWADMQVSEQDGTITYSSGKKLCGMVTADLTHKTATKEVFESGASIYNKTYVVGGSIALTTHSLSEVDKAHILHSITVDETNIDYEVGGDEDTPKRGAFGFALLKENHNTGEPYYVCFWYLDCSFGPADASYGTSDQNGINGEPDKLTINFVRRPGDRHYRRTAVVKSIEEMENFFKTVRKPA